MPKVSERLDVSIFYECSELFGVTRYQWHWFPFQRRRIYAELGKRRVTNGVTIPLPSVGDSHTSKFTELDQISPSARSSTVIREGPPISVRPPRQGALHVPVKNSPVGPATSRDECGAECVFVCALDLIANLFKEEIVFASLTAAAIAVARCLTFFRYHSDRSTRAVQCRHLLCPLAFQSLAFHLHTAPPNDIPAIVVCAF
jgi:hypothetical protein